jgi:hypothetical protein
METSIKSTIRTLAVFAIFFVMYCLSCMFWLKRFAPAPGVVDYDGLKKQGVPVTAARRVVNPPDHLCLFGDIKSVMWTLPSGPPAYLIDSSGKLVDFTSDVGDSTKFQREYRVFDSPTVPLATIERELGMAP